MTTAATGQRLWTILSLLEWSTGALRERDIEDPRLNAELLLCRVLACERIDLYLKFDKILTAEELAAYKTLFKRRLAREPIQYILGETEFMGLRLSVDPRVFIPRPETEILVEEAGRDVASRPAGQRRVLDVGTGSGNIAIALASSVEGCVIDAIDSSAEALEVARMNVGRHHLEERITLRQADFLIGVPGDLHPPYELLLSNPPYISDKEGRTLPPDVRDHEPRAALGGGADGLRFYHAIADRGRELLHSGGRVYVETGYDQAPDVSRIFRERGYADVSTVRDFGGHVRVVRAGIA